MSTLPFLSSLLISGLERTLTFKFSIRLSSSSVSVISSLTTFLISETFQEKTEQIATLKTQALHVGSNRHQFGLSSLKFLYQNGEQQLGHPKSLY
jgi:hypothetical protein